MARIVLGIEYDGSHFTGWQCQNHQRTAQEELEKALSLIGNQTIKVQCAGRTDTGVHALEQVVHFDTDADRTLDNWVMGVIAIYLQMFVFFGQNLPLTIFTRVLVLLHAITDMLS